MIAFNKRCAILIDGNNIQRTIKDKYGDYRLDYRSYIEKVLGPRSLTSFTYLVEGLRPDLMSKLEINFKAHYFGRFIYCDKSADVPLAVEAIKVCESVDTIIIFSGDADYISLVEYLQARGKFVETVSVKENTSFKLRQSVDKAHFITKEDLFSFTENKASVELEN